MLQRRNQALLGVGWVIESSMTMPGELSASIKLERL
jgi:hypothetical protein